MDTSTPYGMGRVYGFISHKCDACVSKTCRKISSQFHNSVVDLRVHAILCSTLHCTFWWYSKKHLDQSTATTCCWEDMPDHYQQVAASTYMWHQTGHALVHILQYTPTTEYEQAFFYNDPEYIAWLVDMIAPALALSSTPPTGTAAPLLVDLGGGTGNFTHALATRLMEGGVAWRRALCVDNSADMLRQVVYGRTFFSTLC